MEKFRVEEVNAKQAGWNRGANLSFLIFPHGHDRSLDYGRAAFLNGKSHLRLERGDLK
jgi:hypothetical protein